MIRIAVVGSLVEDRIAHRDGRVGRGLGGIAYAVAALSALGGDSLRVLPVCRVGEDRVEGVRRHWTALGNVELGGLIVDVPRLARVEITYGSGAVGGDRSERLLDPPPPLERSQLEPAVTADRVLLNCITGDDVELEAAEWLAAASGPLHLDLHSLLLARAPGGERSPRRHPEIDRWAALPETLQCNEVEAALAAGRTAPDDWLRARLQDGPRAAMITGGAGGARLFERRRRARHAPAREIGVVDPTGAGDVFGAAFVLARARGCSPWAATLRGVEAATASCLVQGAERLASIRAGTDAGSG